jgi:hypothetical protein
MVVVVELSLFFYNFGAPLFKLTLIIFCGTLSFDGVPMLASIAFPLLEVRVTTFGGCPLVGVPLLAKVDHV